MGLPRRRRQVEEAPELTPDRLEVGRELLGGEESPFVGLASRVADQPGAAPGEQDGAMAGELQPAQREDAEQVPDVQAVRGRIEAGIGGRRPGVEKHPECFVAHLLDEVAKREILREGRHPQSVPRHTGRRRAAVP